MTISVIGNVNIDIILRDVDELAEPGGGTSPTPAFALAARPE
jgi:sugar/nucleoside kinase (ribokinase family)